MTTAIILAGGLGTRLRSVIQDIPKPMALVKKRPFLEHLMDYWISQGVSHFILSIGYLSKKIVSHFGDTYKNIPITYSVEKSLLGTGGGLLLSLKKTTEENVLVLNGDTFFKVNFNEFKSFHTKQNSILSIALFEFNESNRYGGINLNQNKKITSIEIESKQLSGLANGGVYLIKSEEFLNIFKQKINKKSSFENNLMKELINNKKNVSGRVFKEKFIDIGLPADYRVSSDII